VAETGTVVVLNGTSSSGKTSLAQEFQELRAVRGECWVVFGIDEYLAKLPLQWVDVDTWQGPFGAHGICLERDGDDAHFRIGPVGRRLLAAFRGSVAQVARQGLNVVVDNVTIDGNSWDEWCAALDGIPSVWVAVRCNVDVAERRELDRGDRALGLARTQAAIVHRDPDYDLEVDTTRASAVEVARRLDACLGGGTTPAG
jgi:chloramphenicol 3-O phosphotransferase